MEKRASTPAFFVHGSEGFKRITARGEPGMAPSNESPAADIAHRVTRLIEPVLEDLGLELVDVEYLSERGRWILRIYADREGGITLDDCAMVSREIGDLIDIKDIIAHEYVLEVSSPGLNRPLRKERDFEWAVGRKIRVRMHAPLKGRRNFTGYLKEFSEGMLHLECTGLSASLPWQDVEKANLVYEFDSIKKA